MNAPLPLGATVAERISGPVSRCGASYGIITFRLPSGAYLVRGTVNGREVLRVEHVPEGACGIRIDVVERVRRACLVEVSRLVLAAALRDSSPVRP